MRLSHGDSAAHGGEPGLVLFNQRDFQRSDICYEVTSQGEVGELRIANQVCKLQDFQAAYQREPEHPPLCKQCRAFHDTLTCWLKMAKALIMKRNLPIRSNGSKPYQVQLIRQQGFKVRETLITNGDLLLRSESLQFHKESRNIVCVWFNDTVA
jgi:hypothetical protein